MANVKIGIDIDAKINKGINSQLDTLEKKFSAIQSVGNKGGFGEKIKEDVQSAKAEIAQLREEFNDIYDSFKNQKLDTKEFDNFVKSMKASIDEMNKRVSEAEEGIKKLEIAFKAGQNSSIFEKRLTTLQNQIDDFTKKTQNGISALIEFNKLVNSGSINKSKGSTSDLEKGIEKTINSFTFKDGGVKIPVTLDSSQLSILKKKYDEIINMLQQYADNHPVDVTMRLFPLNTTKAGAKEVSEAVKNVQAQIASLPEGELKTSMNSLYNDLEKQFQKALRLKIDVDLGETQQSVKQRIKELNDSIKEEGFTIYPNFKITDEDSEAIGKKLSELQEKITLKVTSEIKKMSDSLTDLFTTTNVEKWTNDLIDGLNKIQAKLETITPLLNQLNGITSNKNNNVKKNIPDESDVNVIIEFTNAMKALRSSLETQKNVNINIDIQPIIDKLEVLKATIVMVHSGLGSLQATLANTKNTGGLQTIYQSLQKIEEVISQINTEKNGLQIQVTGDIDVNSFINDIQSKIQQESSGVKIPITVLDASIDSFIREIQFAIDSRLTNGDIGGDYLSPSSGDDLGANQITALNRRIGSLKTKIESVWESWYVFAQGAISGTNTAQEGVAKVINKIEELGWALQAISNSFNGVDFSKQISDLSKIMKTADIGKSAKNSSKNIASEAKALEDVYNKALLATQAKDKFANANKNVLESVIKSLAALNSEGKGFENLNKLIRNLANNKDDRITDMVANLELLRDALSTPVKDDSFIKALQKIAEQGENLKALATVLKASVKQINNAKGALNNNSNTSNNSTTTQLKEQVTLENQLANYKKMRIQLIQQGYSEESKTIGLIDKAIELISLEINSTNKLSDAEKKRLEELKQEIVVQKQAESQTKTNYSSQMALLKEVNTWIGKNQIAYSEYKKRLDAITNSLSTGTALTIQELDGIRNAFRGIVSDAEAAGKTGSGLATSITKRFISLASYTATFTTFYDFIRYGRRYLDMIKEFDVNLTEMRKVSDETVMTLKDFQEESFGIADAVGSTADVIQDSTADWMRLGESIEEAKKSAENASILFNVSEFSSIDEATTSLVAMSQAFDDMEKIDIIDKLNNIGNNYSISTDQLATGLQNAAAALKTQGNDIDESIALLTAANSVVQDISKASSGIRTISLRIAGTKEAKEDLEELGESVDDYIVQTESKTQETIKNYTAVASNMGKGIDVLDANGNLRNTYEILLDISKIYKEIQEEDKQYGTNRASALVEYIAGKNRSNIAASILNSPDLLESVYQSSQNSEGSAMEENEKYLDSIEGRMNRLKNRWQEIWASDEANQTIKNLIDSLQYSLDTGSFDNLLEKFSKLINLFDSAVSHINLIKGALIATFSGKVAKTILTFVSDFNSFINATKDFARTGNTLREFYSITNSITGNNKNNISTLSNLKLAEANVLSYRNAISELSAEEAVYVLQSNGFTQAQARQILLLEDGTTALTNYNQQQVMAAIQAGQWTKVTKVLNTEQLKELAARKIDIDALKKELIEKQGLQLSEEGEIVTTKKLNVEKLRSALMSQGMSEADIEAQFAKWGLVSATNAETFAMGLLTRSVNELKLAFLGNPLTAAITAVTAAFTIAVSAYTAYVDKCKEVAEAIQEISENYSEARETINNYRTEISELREKLADQETSTEDVKEATARLYEIQNDLVGTYGAYASGIELVNGNLEKQLDLLTEINKQNAQSWKNEVNNQRTAKASALNLLANTYETLQYGAYSRGQQELNFISDLINGKSFKEATNNLLFGESAVWGFNAEDLSFIGDTLTQTIDSYENFKDSIDATDNEKVNELIDSFENFEVIDGKIKIAGNVDDITESIQLLQVQLGDLGYDDEHLSRQLTESFNKAKQIQDDYGKTYQNSLYYDISTKQELLEYYNQLEEAYKSYQDAVTEGDERAISKERENFMNMFADMENSDIDDRYKDYFENIYDDLQNEISSWKLDNQIAEEIFNDKSLENYLASNSIDKIISDYYKLINDSDNLTEATENNLMEIIQYADEAGVSVASLVTSLKGLDKFNATSAKALLRQSSVYYNSSEEGKNIINGLSSSVIEAVREYKNAVQEYNEFNYNGRTVDKSLLTNTFETEDGFAFTYTPKMINPVTGEESDLSPDEVEQYLNYIIENSKNENGELDWNIALELDKKGSFVTDESGRMIEVSNILGIGGSLDNAAWASEYGYLKKNNEIINKRAEAFKNLYIEASNAGVTIQELEEAFDSGLNWTDEEIDAYVNKLNDKDLATLLTIGIDELSTIETEEELDELIDEYQQIAHEEQIKLPFKLDPESNAEAVESLDDMKDSFDDLATAYLVTVKNQDSSGNATNFTATASDIQAVNDAFGGVTEIEADTAISDINALSNALEAYSTTLIENKGDAEEAQKAADKLATAYVDQSGILDDLTEENKEYYIEQLEANGITNARAVIESRLSKQAKITSKNLQTLSRQMAKYGEAIEEVNKESEDYIEGMPAVIETITNLLTVYNDEGIATLIPNINESFVLQHLEDIKLATEGDIDALNRLRIEAAKLAANEVYMKINIPSDVVETQLDKIVDYIDYVNTKDIEVGASVDMDEYLDGLVTMVKASDTAADAVFAAFESMGYKVEWIPHPYKVTTLKANQSNIKDSKAYSAMMEQAEKTIDVPELKITRTSKATGSSVNNYTGKTSSSSSDSDSDSDSSSDSSNDFSNSFDWIERAIDRVEEELDRLDEQVDNTYKNWTSRNEALLEEISKTGDEIKLQADASKKYEELANEVAIPEEYKIKVQAGELSVEDIDESMITEEIREYFNEKLAEGIGDSDFIEKYTEGTLTDSDYAEMLSNNIDEYEDLIDKAQEATDKETELTKTVLDYHKQIFEDIQTQLDEIVSEIDNKVDLIDKRMTRSEEMGYFVNTDYYDQLIDLTQEKIDARSYQIEQATQAMNQAVENGMEKNSEEWYEMYNNILEMVGDQEEDITQKIKYENEKRQQLWDRADWIEERMNDYVDEAEFIRGLLDGEKLFEDDGQFTKYGVTNLALLSSEYQANVAEAERYRSQYEALQEDLKKSPGDKNLIERLETIKKGWQDATSAVQDNEKAIQEALKASVDQYLSNLQEIINKYKEALQSSKDLYDWQKNVSDQTTNIANLEKQINAYANDDSEEARKTRQELQKQLDEAQQSLEESQWDHYISETGNMLDDMYDKLSDYLEEQTEDIHVVRTLMEEYVNNHETEATEGLTAIESIYNVTADYFDHVDDGDANTSILTDIKTTLNNIYDGWKFIANPEENGNTNEVEYESSQLVVNDDGTVSLTRLNGDAPSGTSDYWGNTSDATDASLTKLEETAETLEKLIAVNGSWESDEKGEWYKYNDGSYAKNEWLDLDGTQFYFDEEGYLAKDQYVDGKLISPSGEAEADGYEWKQEDGKWWYGNSENYATGHVKIDGQWHTFDDEGWWLGAYAKGSKSISRTGIGITNEDGSELVWRTDSGALLTPLNQGDMVFTSDMSRRLWEVAKGNIPSGMNITMPSISGSSPQNVTANNNISIELPNVKNYDEFKKAMKNDSEMEKFWQEITVGQMMGNNTLKKNKY